MSLNRVVLSGNLTRDPELRETPSGTKLCRLGLANNQRRKVDGVWGEVAHFFDVTVWGSQGETVAKFLSKGSPVAVDGRLEYRSWEKDGAKRSAVEVVADHVEFLGSRGSGGQPEVREPEPAQDDSIPF